MVIGAPVSGRGVLMSDRESLPDSDPAPDDAAAPDDYEAYRMPFGEPMSKRESVPGGDADAGSDAGSDADPAADAKAARDVAKAYRMPFTVRAAQVLAVGLAVI